MSGDELRVGFLGAGRMAQALSKGFVQGGLTTSEHIIASDVEPAALTFIEKECGVRTTSDNKAVVQSSQVIVLAVKPHIVAPVLTEVASVITDSQLVVSIAAGITISNIEKLLPDKTRVIRVMPNTPALVQTGTSAYSAGSHSTPQDSELVSRMFSCVGICSPLPERLLDAVTGLSGSGPAYGFLAIEALSDGAVMAGLPRDVATRFAAQTLMGAARMVVETGQHPGQLKDAVCSPGGTTIAGVHALEEGGFRAALMNAVKAATQQSKALGQQ